MNPIIIVGAGSMGTAVGYAISKLGHSIYLVDSDLSKAKSSKNKIEHLLNPSEVHIKTMEDFEAKKIDGDVGVVISCAPFIVNRHLAEIALSIGWSYCDLGGNPEVSSQIEALAENAENKSIFTDLGIAPGLVNILAEHGYQKLSEYEVPHAVLMRVGGLPAKRPINSLGYGLTFNAAGLYNEYMGDCKIIDKGQITTAPALSNRIDVHYPQIGDYEEFLTKGGANKTIDLMHERGVQFCNYKTLRYPGHIYNLKFLLHECKLSQEQFTHAVENCCGYIVNDKIVLSVQVESRESYLEFKNRELHGWRRAISFSHDENWTAMQKGTAFPTAAVASLMAGGQMANKAVLNYSDVPIEEFKTKLEEIGGLPTNEMF